MVAKNGGEFWVFYVSEKESSVGSALKERVKFSPGVLCLFLPGVGHSNSILITYECLNETHSGAKVTMLVDF